MTTSVTDMETLIYKCTEGIDLSDYNISIKSFNILNTLDGHRNIQTIAEEESYDFDDLQRKISQLHAMGLVEIVGSQSQYATRQTMKQLANHLSIYVGPIAGIIIDEIAEEMGCSSYSIPLHKMVKLIHRIGEKISDKAQAEEFLQKAISLIS